MIGRWLPFFHTRLLAISHLPLAALISLETLRNALSTLGYPAVTLFVMIESSGIPFPGETMLLLASFYAAVDQKLQIPFVIVCAALGAIIGDNIGYTVGRTGGYAFIRRFGRYLFLKQEHLEKAERFFAKHGDKTVFFGRFIAVLRAWAAFLAGLNRMRWPSFLIYNAAGGIVWATIYGCLGFYAGRLFHDNFGAVEQLARTISWAGAALIVVAVIVVIIIFRLRRKHRVEDNSHKEENAAEETPPSETQKTVKGQHSSPGEANESRAPSLTEKAPAETNHAQVTNKEPQRPQEVPSSDAKKK